GLLGGLRRKRPARRLGHVGAELGDGPARRRRSLSLSGRAASAFGRPASARREQGAGERHPRPLESLAPREAAHGITPVVWTYRSFRKTTPPFITKAIRSNSVMSASGSPLTATRSANLPFSTIPTCLQSSKLSPSAALMVATRS